MSERYALEISDAEFKVEALDMAGDNMNVLSRDGSLFDFEIEEPWAGCTETGFGERCDFSLDRRTAMALADWIYARLGFPSPPHIVSEEE